MTGTFRDVMGLIGIGLDAIGVLVVAAGAVLAIVRAGSSCSSAPSRA